MKGLLLAITVGTALATANSVHAQECSKLEPALMNQYFSGNSIELAVTGNGTYSINNQPVRADSLQSQLQAIYRPRPVSKRILYVRCEDDIGTDLTEIIKVSSTLHIALFRTPRGVAL